MICDNHPIMFGLSMGGCGKELKNLGMNESELLAKD